MKIAVPLMALWPTVASALDLTMQPQVIEECLAQGGAEACIGVAANKCTDSDDGATTVGLGFCLGAERDWWDARLNDAYTTLMQRERAADAEMAAIGASVPVRATALRDMQRAWIAFRDAACLYEFSQWGGGTGGTPAHAACAMQLTGRQALALQERLATK